MKKKFLGILLIVFIGPVILSPHANAKRQKFSVTGSSGDINTYYDDMVECSVATRNAFNKANNLCYEEGYSYFVRAQWENCRSNIFTGGKTRTVVFFCE